MGITKQAVVTDAVESAEGIGVQVEGIEEGGSLEPVTTGLTAARRSQRGMVSAEWAVGIIAAVALAGVLIMVITKGPIEDALLQFILHVIASFSGYIQGR